MRPREGGLRRGEIFWLRLTTASAQCLRLSERFFDRMIFSAELYAYNFFGNLYYCRMLILVSLLCPAPNRRGIKR